MRYHSTFKGLQLSTIFKEKSAVKIKFSKLKYFLPGCLFLLIGCADASLLKDMDALYTSPGHEGSNVSAAVQKYFPVGMPVETALKQLQKMGINIRESRYDRSRTWPNGKWHYAGSNPQADPNMAQTVRRSFKEKTDIHYWGEKIVDRWRIIVYRKYVIKLVARDGKILESEGFIHLYGL